MTPLNDLYGQDVFKKIIRNSFNRDRIASTYLFYGDEGVGKWAGGIALAALLNCEKPVVDETGNVFDACGECRNCRQISGYNFAEMYFAVPLPPHRNAAEEVDLTLEYLKLKKKEPYHIVSSTRQLTIPISMAREIKRRTAIMPPRGVKRVIIFDQMEKMLAASADSLLKLIEEPPPETVIILTARDPEHLLPTIQSRAQKIRFKPIGVEEISDYLKAGYDLPDEKAGFYARLARGSIGRAITSIENENESSLRQTAFLVFKGLFTRDNPSSAAIACEFINPNDRGETERVLTWWQSFLSDIIRLKFGRDSSAIVNNDYGPELGKMGDRVTQGDGFSRMLNDIKETTLSLRRNVHIKPAVVKLVFNLRRYLDQSA
nr:hypothetical protein [candidate division Zixibacteria bacterium]